MSIGVIVYPNNDIDNNINNYVSTYEYYPDGKIHKEIITGDLSQITEYTYIQNGLQNEGKILTEKITKNGVTTVRTFQYDSNGKIISTELITL